MKKFFVLIGCLLYIYSVYSQGTWRTVDSLYRARAYADAYTLTRQCYEQSLQALAAPAAAHSPAMQGVHAYNLFRSAVSLVKVSAKLPNPVDAESLMRRTLPKLDAYPEGALCHTYLAHVYAQKLLSRNNRFGSQKESCFDNPADTLYSHWSTPRLADSIRAHTRAALADSLTLRRIPIASPSAPFSYDFFVSHDTVTDYSDITLYEIVLYAAVKNLVNDRILYSSSDGFTYTDALFDSLANPATLVSLRLPAGGTPHGKLRLFQHAARWLQHECPDTAHASWQLFRINLMTFLAHFSEGYRRDPFGPFLPQGTLTIHQSPTVTIDRLVTPDSGCFLTVSAPQPDTLYLRITPSIDMVLDNLPNDKRLAYALAQPVLHSLAIPVAKGSHRYSFPSLPYGEYTLLSSETPFPSPNSEPDPDFRTTAHHFVCNSAYIQPITSLRGLLLDAADCHPLAYHPVKLRFANTPPDADSEDTLSLTTATDSLGLYDFHPLLPEGANKAVSYTTTYRGQTCTQPYDGHHTYYLPRSLSAASAADDIDTVVSLFLNAHIYRPSDTVRFSAMVHLVGPDGNARPLANHSLQIKVVSLYPEEVLGSTSLTTDPLGWAEGLFVISHLDSRVLDDGNPILDAYIDGHFISHLCKLNIADYSLPTLSLTLQASCDTPRYARPLTIEGRIASRNGSAVTATCAAYTVRQSFGYAPWVKGVGSDHSGGSFLLLADTVAIRPDGTFTIPFTPAKHPDLPFRNGEYTQYDFEVTVTDPSGLSISESITLAVSDLAGSISILSYHDSWYDLVGGYNSNFINSLDDIFVSAESFGRTNMAVKTRVTVGLTPLCDNVMDTIIAIPDHPVALAELLPDFPLPNGCLTITVSDLKRRFHPDTLVVTHLNFDAPLPPDSLDLFASIQHNHYRVGDTLRLRVGSPHRCSAMLLIASGDSIVTLRHLRLNRGFQRLALPLSNAMAGQLAVSLVMLRNGHPLQGHASVTVTQPNPRLQIHWTNPEGFNLTPPDEGFAAQRLYAGASQRWQLRVTDTLGRPVQANLALTAFDDAIYTLADDHYLSGLFTTSLNLQQYQPSISFSYYDNQSKKVALFSPSETPIAQTPYFDFHPTTGRKWHSFGLTFVDLPQVGAFLSVGTPGVTVLYCLSASQSIKMVADLPESTPLVRTNLTPIGPWFGRISTDSQGTAAFTFPAPQRLSSWILQGVAIDSAGHTCQFGNRFITYRDVMLHPNLPPFLYPGDRTDIAVRLDRATPAAPGSEDRIRLCRGAKPQGRCTEAAPSPTDRTALFPIKAPRPLFTSRPRPLHYTFAALNCQHDSATLLDALSATVPVLPVPRLSRGLYPLSRQDYRTLSDRFRSLFYPYNNHRPNDVSDLFDSLYYAVVFHRPNADSLLQVLSDAQLPSGGWPCIKGQKTIFNEDDILHHLSVIMKLQQECPDFRLPAAFNIERTLQLADSLMFKFWRQYPHSAHEAARWLTLHRHFAQYPLSAAYRPMHDSLYANLLAKGPDMWDILLLHRCGDTAVARRMARDILQSSHYDPAHPEAGRYWGTADHNGPQLVNYIAILEEVLHDTLSANQVRQRINYLAPTTYWPDMDRATLVSHHLLPPGLTPLNSLPPTAAVRGQQAQPLITLSREIVDMTDATASATVGQYAVRLTLTLSRPMDHLLLRSPSAACFAHHDDPVLIVTAGGHGDRDVPKTFDANLSTVDLHPAEPANCMDIYLNHLPAGTYLIEYSVGADRSGRFLLPPATVECIAVCPKDLNDPRVHAATSSAFIER